ncbi:MAG: PadR family transcriptional regulator [Candidatus Bathyarchaeota archaeon]|nr:PadR family transcriptional regulator [Candidatus Bathyarchaeota archaeon]
MNCSHRHHFGRWMRHMASVPKGFLKYSVLKLLDEKSRSGSEIMNEIESKTEGRWKPSPGSIYPLLAWLQEKGYTKEAPDQEPGMKRYTLTDEGKAFLEEHVKRRKEIQERFGAFRPPFYRFPWLNSYPEKAKELLEAGKSFMKASWSLLDKLREKYTEEAATQAKEVFKQATEKLNEIAKKLEQAD